MKILVIEDDPQIVEVVSLSLRIRWPEADVISTHLGEKGLEMVENESPTVVILDLGLPDISGYEILKRIRLFADVPVIILTSRDDEADIVKGLEWGADDYITKPFRQMELISRVRAVMRRNNDTSHELMRLGELRFDPDRLEVIFEGRKIALTRTEGDIFYHLMKNAGQVVTYDSLAEAVWGSDYTGATDALKVHVRRLREKLEIDPGEPQLILTRPSAGYYLAVPPKEPQV